MEKIKSEHQEQVRLVNILRNFYPEVLFFAVPNGGKRDPREAKRLKDEGVLSGVADLVFPEARNGFNGLFLELKRIKGGKQSETQKAFELAVIKRGYEYKVAKGAKEALEVVKSYFGFNDDLRLDK